MCLGLHTDIGTVADTNSLASVCYLQTSCVFLSP